MSNGLYIAASGLIAQQTRLDTVANDLANVNTAGYKNTRISLEEVASGNGGDASGSGVRVGAVERRWTQGALLESTDPLAVALNGQGFLQAKLADGTTVLTRRSDLRVDGKSQLTFGSGERVEPAITLPSGTIPDQIGIASDGTVTVDGKKVGQLSIVDVPAPGGLLHLGDGYFQPSTASGQPAPVKDTTIQQGYIEGSNVDIASAMVEMIETQRAFELASRSLRAFDQLLEIANGIRR
jgi:flagellar basal-body rod protein FlgG